MPILNNFNPFQLQRSYFYESVNFEKYCAKYICYVNLHSLSLFFFRLSAWEVSPPISSVCVVSMHWLAISWAPQMCQGPNVAITNSFSVMTCSEIIWNPFLHTPSDTLYRARNVTQENTETLKGSPVWSPMSQNMMATKISLSN